MPTVSAAAVGPQLPKQLSDQGSLGTCLGVSATDLIGFYRNDTGVVQPSGAQFGAVSRGQQAGLITTYATTQSPSIVNTITSGERAFTVQTGTGATVLPGFGTPNDLFIVNKPTSQAGLGVGNVRVSASNVVQVEFTNPSAGNITPTASEVYKLVGVRGIGLSTVSLSPASVAANTTIEQQFTLASTVGIPVGELLQVSKPTAQAGLAITGCRIVSSNVIGITFSNVTAALIVPTAAETYTLFSYNGLDAVNNFIFYQFNVGTVGAIGAGIVVSGGSTALAGALATDSVVGIQKPTLQAVATNASIVYPGGSVFTADVLTLGFFGVGTGSTPTASEVYGVTAHRINPAAPLVLYSQSLAPVSVAANTCAEQTFTVTGLVANSVVWVNKVTSAQQGLGIAGVRVSAANTLAINYINTSAVAIVPATEVYTIGNFQMVSPGTGNSASQAVLPSLDDVLDFAGGMRTALGPTQLNLIAAG